MHFKYWLGQRRKIPKVYFEIKMVPKAGMQESEISVVFLLQELVGSTEMQCQGEVVSKGCKP
jgi:hypothetical protein